MVLWKRREGERVIWFTEGVRSTQGTVIHQLAGEVDDRFKMRCGGTVKGYNAEFIDPEDYAEALTKYTECTDCVYLEWKEQQ